ncbi:Antimicrobial peptide MBP-1 related (LEM1) [Quillaja saponaria]|uniref:Antimicrobial peptide MBP-1 related (LEM1) n=1 Tax=Quillaja saponaria TaxID=32244 RepID=A0AAD7VHY2_QUISA|nr:Antimicrobial peptide MBP-1 related (LEM1) [Quillaja saponaria]
MAQDAKSVVRFVLVFLICFGVAHAQNQKPFQQCLGVCGQDVVLCAIHCFTQQFMNFLPCAGGCGQTNLQCMGSCTNTTIPLPPAPPVITAGA